MSETTTNPPKGKPCTHHPQLRYKAQTYICVVSLAVLIVCGGCRNPWMENILINLYHIGDKGPGGGIVFYRSAKGFTDTYSGKTHYFLEAAPVDMPADMPGPLQWANFSNVTGATGTAIGTGRANTKVVIDFVNAYSGNCPAVYECYNYRNSGKTDWFLPSKNELNQLWHNRKAVNDAGGNLIINDNYWSSSENDSNTAWFQDFDTGVQLFGTTKTGGAYVRPIRSF